MRTRPGSWRCRNRDRRGRVRANKLTLSGAARCSGRGRAQGHARRRECARSRVPGDAAPFRLLNEKSTSTNFRIRATRPDDWSA